MSDTDDLYGVRDQLRAVDRLLQRLSATALSDVEKHVQFRADIDQLRKEVDEIKNGKAAASDVASLQRKAGALYDALHRNSVNDQGVLTRLTILEENVRTLREATPQPPQLLPMPEQTGEISVAKELAQTNRNMTEMAKTVLEKVIVPVLSAIAAYLAAKGGF